jgi:hypothetical protein
MNTNCQVARKFNHPRIPGVSAHKDYTWYLFIGQGTWTLFIPMDELSHYVRCKLSRLAMQASMVVQL